MNLKSMAAIDWLAAAYLIGTVLGLYFSLVFPVWLYLLVFSFLVFLALIFRQKKLVLKLIFYFLILSLGYLRSAKASQSSIVGEGVMSLRGFIAEYPVLLERSQRFPLKTDLGTVWVTTGKYPAIYSYGDNLEVFGDWRRVNNRVEARFPKVAKLLGSQKSPLYDLVFAFREKFRKTTQLILPEPQATLASGILLGAQGATNKQFIENLRKTGTSHIVSVSGFNISIIISGLIVSLSLIPTTSVLPILVLIVMIFDLMVGFTAPILRATFMGLFIFVAKIAGRQQNLIDALLVSAVAIAALDPISLTSLSFQLSFLATLGIIGLNPYFERWLGFVPSLLRKTLSATLSAQLAVLPVVIYNFGTISLISPLANLLVAWTIVPAMALTLLTGFLGQVFLPLGQIFGVLDFVVLTYFVKVIDLLARVPWAVIQL